MLVFCFLVLPDESQGSGFGGLALIIWDCLLFASRFGTQGSGFRASSFSNGLGLSIDCLEVMVCVFSMKL